MVYQLHISLLFSDNPKIWRRILIPSEADFLDLHYAIQGAMGWELAHLYEFKDKLTKPRLFIADDDVCMDRAMIPGVEVRPEEDTFLDDVFVKKGDKFIYSYDFGDSWEHEITLEAIRPESDWMFETPQIIQGQGACPPEDIGGVPGYMHMKQAVADPQHEEYDHYADWLGLDEGETFNPEAFNLAEMQEYLDAIFEEAYSDIDEEDLFEWPDEDDE